MSRGKRYTEDQPDRAILLAQAPDDVLISVGFDGYHVSLRTVARFDSLDKSSLKTSHNKDYPRRP
jgi:hypothetical protein